MLAELNIDELRAETPGCDKVAFFNHSGASLPTQSTLAAIFDHLKLEASIGAMEAASGVQTALQDARTCAAQLIGSSAEEIALVTSGSAAFGLAFAALPPFHPGDRILVGRHEWGGNLGSMRLTAAASGASIETIPCRDDGSIDAEALLAMIDDKVRLVSLTWLPANGGLINDAAAIGKVTRAAGVPYFIDAGQALGQIPIDVAVLGCDVLKASCRKYVRGPRGTAVLYVRKDFLPRLRPVFYDVQSAPWGEAGPSARPDARVFETIEGSVSLVLGLRAALQQALQLGIPVIRRRIASLADMLRAELQAIPGVSLHDLGTDRSGLVSFTINGLGAQDTRVRLGQQRIVVGANGVPYTPLDMTARNLPEIVRASVSYFNTEAEITRLAASVTALARSAA
jgi:selenocysteine lyase/cysteine desulfurase